MRAAVVRLARSPSPTRSCRVLTKAEVQRLRSLREKKHREALGLFVIEGEKVIAELLAAQFPLVEFYATETWGAPSGGGAAPPPRKLNLATVPPSAHSPDPTRAAKAPQLQPTRVTAEEMARISHFPTPSALLAVGKIARRPLATAALASGLTLALDGIQDPGNVGTLLRIADWFGFDRVVLSPECADVFNQKVINASMGSFARVTVHVADLPGVLEKVSPGVAVLGCDLVGDDVHTLPPLRAAIVVIGNEGHGLSPAVAARLTQRVTIPRFGRAESLNAAVAAAIVCDNVRRLYVERLP